MVWEKLRNSSWGWGDEATIRLLAAPSEGLSLIPSIHDPCDGSQQSVTPVLGVEYPLLVFEGTKHGCGPQAYMQAIHINKIKIRSFVPFVLDQVVILQETVITIIIYHY